MQQILLDRIFRRVVSLVSYDPAAAAHMTVPQWRKFSRLALYDRFYPETTDAKLAKNLHVKPAELAPIRAGAAYAFLRDRVESAFHKATDPASYKDLVTDARSQLETYWRTRDIAQFGTDNRDASRALEQLADRQMPRVVKEIERRVLMMPVEAVQLLRDALAESGLPADPVKGFLEGVVEDADAAGA